MADQIKRNADDVGNAEHVQATENASITNIYYDCLEHISKFLDVESLLNLADTCKRLRIGAAHYFGESMNDKSIALHETDNDYPAVRVIEVIQLISVV